jgi:hypothetical protein
MAQVEPLKWQKFAGWEGRFTPACVNNAQAQIVSGYDGKRPGNKKDTLRLENDESAGVNCPSQPANLPMLSSITDRCITKEALSPYGHFRLAENDVTMNAGWDREGQPLSLKNIPER